MYTGSLNGDQAVVPGEIVEAVMTTLIQLSRGEKNINQPARRLPNEIILAMKFNCNEKFPSTPRSSRPFAPRGTPVLILLPCHLCDPNRLHNEVHRPLYACGLCPSPRCTLDAH
jgi:hypothetical protein